MSEGGPACRQPSDPLKERREETAVVRWCGGGGGRGGEGGEGDKFKSQQDTRYSNASDVTLLLGAGDVPSPPNWLQARHAPQSDHNSYSVISRFDARLHAPGHEAIARKHTATVSAVHVASLTALIKRRAR